MRSPRAEARLTELGIVLPPARPPVGNFTPAVRHGRLCFLSGQGPVTSDGARHTGSVGVTVDIAEARDHARLTTLNLLSALRAEVGSLDRVVRIVKLFGMINASELPDGHDEVMAGAAQLLVEIFGPETGRGAGTVLGLSSLPSGITVEIELVVAIDHERE